MTIKIQHLVITGLLILGAFYGMYLYLNGKNNELIEDIKKDLQTEKELAIKQRDTALANRRETINQLKEQNEKAKAESAYWYEQAKRRGVNPVYDLDFLTAADVIAKSRYKPGE